MNRPDTKTRLLDAAEKLVRQNGAEGFSYGDLSQTIGIRKASIHYHFPAKADLLGALMVRYSERFTDSLHALSTADLTAAEQIDSFLGLYRDAAGEGHRLCLCIAYSLSPGMLSDDTRRAVAAFRVSVLGWLRETFAKAAYDRSVSNPGDPAREANAALALSEGAQIAARFAGDVAQFDRAVALFRSRLTGGETGGSGG